MSLIFRQVPIIFHPVRVWVFKNDGHSWKVNAIWWNIKINLQELTDTCGYELPTNLQNFMQKDLTSQPF